MMILMNIVIWILHNLYFASVHSMIHFDNLSILPNNIIFTNLFLTQFKKIMSTDFCTSMPIVF